MQMHKRRLRFSSKCCNWCTKPSTIRFFHRDHCLNLCIFSTHLRCSLR